MWLMLCGALTAAFERRRRRGDVFLAVGVCYAAVRFWLEIFRADNSLAYWGMSISQVVSIVLATTCVVAFAAGRWRTRGREEFVQD